MRPLLSLSILFVLLACQLSAPLVISTTTLPRLAENYSEKSTSTPLPSISPTATITYTPQPSYNSTPTSAYTPTATALPLTTQLSIFENIWTIVNDTYVYPDFNGLDWAAIQVEYRQKIAAGLTSAEFYRSMSEVIERLGDDHSFFIDPQQVAEQEAEYQGKHDYVGIGVLIDAVPARQHAVVISVFPGSPADAAGIQPRDSILSVDSVPIMDEEGYLRDIVRGLEGTAITLELQTPGEDPRLVRLTRQRITGNYPVGYKVLSAPDGKRIGYILLITFEDSTVDEQVAEALQQMSAEAPLDGLILDIRLNGGGSSTVTEPMLSYFAGGNLGYFVQHGEERPFRIKNRDIFGSTQVPLVVLVGSGTASFGEIFAGILQDLGRAYLIGTTTEGNVEILWGYDLEDGSELWLANETFRPLNHPDQDWEKTGVVPDLIITGEFDQYKLEDDPAVLAAVRYLSGQ